MSGYPLTCVYMRVCLISHLFRLFSLQRCECKEIWNTKSQQKNNKKMKLELRLISVCVDEWMDGYSAKKKQLSGFLHKVVMKRNESYKY